MKYFKHDSDASLDAKLKRVQLKFGMEGYGFYWYCIEMIARTVRKNNLKFALEDDAQVLAHYCSLDADKVAQMLRLMVDIELFEQEDDIVTCRKLSSRTDEYTQKLIKAAEGVAQCPDTVSTKSALTEQNRTEEIYSAFCAFWLAYPRKKDKSRAEKVFTKIFRTADSVPDLLEVILANVDQRLSTGEWRLDQKKYIPLPTTYLNGENWNDALDLAPTVVGGFQGDDYL